MREDEVWQEAQEAGGGEPPRVERQVPGVQAPQEARPPRLGCWFFLAPPPPQGQRRRGGRLRAPARRRGRPVQRLLPGAGGGLRHTAQGTSSAFCLPSDPLSLHTIRVVSIPV